MEPSIGGVGRYCVGPSRSAGKAGGAAVPRQRLAGQDQAETTRRSLLVAAETCVRRYGIAKTTMGDVAAEAGVARPTVYRYFADRDELLVAVVERRSRMLIDRAAAYIGKQAKLADKLVEGLIFLVAKGRQDEVIRLIVSPEHIHFAPGLLGGSGAAADLTEALWQPILAAAVQAGELDPRMDLRAACVWLAQVQILLVGRLDSEPTDTDAQREMLRAFVLPAFRASNSN